MALDSGGKVGLDEIQTNLECGQHLAGFIVQFMRQAPPFFFLGRHNLLSQAAQLFASGPNLLEQPGVFQGNSQLIGHRLSRVQVIGPERADLPAAQFPGPHHLPFDPQRNDQA